MTLGGPDRVLLALGGLTGFLGVLASAAAAHAGGADSLKTSAQFLLFHAPAVVGLVALAAAGASHRGLTRIAASALLLGLSLFCGDLALRALAATPLFPMAAPAGGIVLMMGWLLVAATAFVRVRS